MCGAPKNSEGRHRQKAYKRRIAQWKAFKNYKSAEKKAIVDCQAQPLEIHDAIPSAQLHGKPIKWDRIKRFGRTQGPKRAKRPERSPPIERKVHLDLNPDGVRPTINVNERILFLTKSYLDWNVSAWSPLGVAKLRRAQGPRSPDTQGEDDLRVFNQCFYNAIPMLLTNRTPEAFKEINLACSLATLCLQRSPYWIFLRLLRLYSYPLWGRFPDVRRQIVQFLQALALRTLPEGHPLKPLLAMWAQEEMEADAGRVASLLRLSSDALGPISGLDAEEWAWIQDEICSLSYQRKDFHDALRIAQRLADDPNVPPGVHITSKQMIARYHLQHGNIEKAQSILFETLDLCEEYTSDDDERARFLQQTFSDLGYLYHVREDRTRSLWYYQQAHDKAVQVNNTANMSSIRCRMEAVSVTQEEQTQDADLTQGPTTSSNWALWAFCRPYS